MIFFRRQNRTARHAAAFTAAAAAAAALTAGCGIGGHSFSAGHFGRGLGRSLAHGVAFGAGSAVGHRIVNGVFSSGNYGGSYSYRSGSSQPAQTGGTGPAEAASGAIRSVHTAGVEIDDMHLQPGQCHLKVIDAAAGQYLPDPACTPGATDPAVTQADLKSTICRAGGYTSIVRPPASVTDRYKTMSLADYSETYSRTTEYDHLISLELGGASTTSNLWPEPNTPGAASYANPKDQVENTLHDAVCSGRVTLAAAQQAIASNWTTALQAVGLG